ncbi:MAG: sensor histidine kinase [Chitinophaga sp.]|uniref:sensor histidine kinase n=1 Tax=Chitinophaga sp. TaxID=1869181 RepID=UPI001B0A2A46|nr:sensor histidine kinase [Chitinophaga sp.]MBO9729434.1 sensor histidine kinase [Chitinophaga sp.]
MITTTGESAAEKWLLALFLSEKKWPRYLFYSVAFVTGEFALPLYAPGTKWSGAVMSFLVLINLGTGICNNLLRGRTIQFSRHLLLSFTFMNLLLAAIAYYWDGVQFYHSFWITLLAFAPFTLCSICIGIGLKLVRYTMQQQYAVATRRKDDLNMLLNQLSPHFLFNTLNNLYGLSLTQSRRMPGLILQLSDLLRYTVYDARQDYVLLQSEIAYINNYIELATTNIGNRLVLTTDIAPVTDPDIKIAPMLLIVFIENAFKHSQNDDAGKIYIDISLTVTEKRIGFTVKNSYNTQATDTITEANGIGLSNTVKRLKLLYSDTYQYHHEKSDGYYTVTLTIPVKK